METFVMTRVSKAEVLTERAASYMKQLCRHWGHKFPVEFDDQRGTIALPKTACLLEASPTTLTVTLNLEESADQNRMEKVVEEHLQRFGFREELVFHWVRS